jgi:hypothetical protein
MKAKILPNIFISVAVLFAFTRLLAAGMSDGPQNFGNIPFVRPQPTFITFDAPGAGTDPGEGTVPQAINPSGTITGTSIDVNFVFHGFLRPRMAPSPHSMHPARGQTLAKAPL